MGSSMYQGDIVMADGKLLPIHPWTIDLRAMVEILNGPRRLILPHRTKDCSECARAWNLYQEGLQTRLRDINAPIEPTIGL